MITTNMIVISTIIFCVLGIILTLIFCVLGIILTLYLMWEKKHNVYNNIAGRILGMAVAVSFSSTVWLIVFKLLGV